MRRGYEFCTSPSLPWQGIMKSKLLAETSGQRTFVIVLDPGEEAFSSLTAFAGQEEIAGVSLTAIGAFGKATAGWFDFRSKSYRKTPVREQREVLSAIGDIAVDKEDKPTVHIHVMPDLGDGSTRGGHCWRALCGRRWKLPCWNRPATCAAGSVPKSALH